MNKLIFVLTLFAATSHAAETIAGWAEFRPTVERASNEFRTENEVGLLFPALPTLRLGYVQEFQTFRETGFQVGDGYLKSEMPLLSGTLQLDHESRLYVPTQAENRGAGFLTAIRNDFKFSLPLVYDVRIALWELPILYGYTRPGDEEAPNPIFENQVQLMFQVSVLDERLNLKTPLIHQWTRYRAVDEWTHTLRWNPELTYSIFDKTQLGFAYSTSNFIDSEDQTSYYQFILNQGI